MMITVKDDDAAFVWVKEWFLEQKFLKRIRTRGSGYDVAQRAHRDDSGAGSALVLVRGQAVLESASHRSEETQGTRLRGAVEVTDLQNDWAQAQRFCRQFVDDVVAATCGDIGSASRFCTPTTMAGTTVEGYAPRLLDSVILQPGEKEHLVQDIAEFPGIEAALCAIWEFPTIAAICCTGRRERGRLRWYRRWRRSFGLSIYAVNLDGLQRS